MPGTLSIRPLSAKLTRNTELFGTMDPYCKFQLGKQNVSGQVCKNGGKHPVWDETLVLKRVNEPMCHLELKEHDWLLPDGLIGECNINLNEIENKQRVLKWYNLSYTGKPVGQILIEINYEAEKGNNYLAPVDKATTGQRVEPEYRGYIPSGNEANRNQLNQQFPGLTEVQNQNNNNYQQGLQPQNNQFAGTSDYLYQQQQYNPYDNNYNPQQQDMFAPPVHENYGNYLQEGQKYPTFEDPSFGNFYSNDQQNYNQGRSNQQHEVIDYRNNQQQTGFNPSNQHQNYPGVTNEPLTHHQRDQEQENAGWDPIRLIRGVMGTKK